MSAKNRSFNNYVKVVVGSTEGIAAHLDGMAAHERASQDESEKELSQAANNGSGLYITLKGWTVYISKAEFMSTVERMMINARRLSMTAGGSKRRDREMNTILRALVITAEMTPEEFLPLIGVRKYSYEGVSEHCAYSWNIFMNESIHQNEMHQNISMFRYLLTKDEVWQGEILLCEMEDPVAKRQLADARKTRRQRMHNSNSEK